MNRQRFFKWLIGGLVLSNLILIVFLIIGKPHHGPHRHPREIIIEKLEFDTEQIAAYDQLIQKQMVIMHSYDVALAKAKNALYLQLQAPEDTTLTDSLLQQVTQVQQRIEEAHFSHFLAIKSLCSAEQQDNFDQLTLELGRLFQPMRPPGKKP